MDAPEDEMFAAVLENNAKAVEKARRELYKLALSADMSSISTEWQRWRCVKMCSSTIRAAVDAAVEVDDDGTNTILCFAVAEILVAMAAVWKLRNEESLDAAIEVISHNHEAAVCAMNGDLFEVCRRRLSSTDRTPHTAVLKKLCAALLAIGTAKTRTVFTAIVKHGKTYTLHNALRATLLDEDAVTA